MTWSRRDLFRAGVAVWATALLAKRARGQSTPSSQPRPALRNSPRPVPAGWRADGTVFTPNGARLPWRVEGRTKVFHLVAEALEHEIVPGLTIEAWGYNGRTPGPTIEVTEGDHCRFYVTNRLDEPTSIHWHGLLLANGLDGVTGLTQKPIAPGETYVYEFTMGRAGTYMYHPHHDEMTQIALGMQGMIVVHPRGPRSARVRDVALMLNEWKVTAGTRRPDPLEMTDFNVLTFNSRSFPGTQPILAELGDTVRLHIGNLSPMEHHPIHVHGHTFTLVATDGGPVPPSARHPETTVLVPVGTVRVLELVASAAGDWPLHCHMTHHAMNQMGHRALNAVGADLADVEKRVNEQVPGVMLGNMGQMMEAGGMEMPVPANSVPMKGADGPFGTIGMGGMFTLLKFRHRLDGDMEPGWYAHPPGTSARPATADDLARDGIDVTV